MASLILGIGGSIVGGYFGGPAGAMAGGAAGSLIGGLIDGSSAKGAHNQGPRLTDLTVQSATYGQPIPRVYGAMRVAGNLIDGKQKLDEVSTTTTDSGGGGKGGAPSTTTTTFTYFATFAVGICAGPVLGVRRIWADGKLIWDLSSGVLVSKFASNITIYFGDELQTPDATLEALHGAGNVPAYRGLCYGVFNGFPVADFANRIPNLTFEIAEAPAAPAPPLHRLAVHVAGATSPHPTNAQPRILNMRGLPASSPYGLWMSWCRTEAGTGDADATLLFWNGLFGTGELVVFQSPNDGGAAVTSPDGTVDFVNSPGGPGPTLSVWSQKIWSYDTVNQLSQFMLDGSIIFPTPPFGVWFNGGVPVVYNDRPWHMQLPNCGPSGSPNSAVSDFFFDIPDAFFDLTNPANLAKLRTLGGFPVDLSSNPASVTGKLPLVYLHGDAGTWQINRGIAGPVIVSANGFAEPVITQATSTPWP